MGGSGRSRAHRPFLAYYGLGGRTVGGMPCHRPRASAARESVVSQ